MVVCWEARSDCAAAGMEEEEGEPARWKDDDAIAAASSKCFVVTVDLYGNLFSVPVSFDIETSEWTRHPTDHFSSPDLRSHFHPI